MPIILLPPDNLLWVGRGVNAVPIQEGVESSLKLVIEETFGLISCSILFFLTEKKIYFIASNSTQTPK